MSEPTDLFSGLMRSWTAAEASCQRTRRTAGVLAAAGVPYAIVGGHAVAAWVETVEEAAVRNTPDVNILVRRPDAAAVQSALTAAGFVHRPGEPLETFLDGPGGGVRSAVRVLFAGERVRPTNLLPTPDVSESVDAAGGFRVIALISLVTMKLTAHRTIDRVHLRDMIDVGLIDATWPAGFPPPLGERLQALLDDPDG